MSVKVEKMATWRGFVHRISYKNDSSDDPHVLVVPGCTELCPLERFKGICPETTRFKETLEAIKKKNLNISLYTSYEGEGKRISLLVLESVFKNGSGQTSWLYVVLRAPPRGEGGRCEGWRAVPRGGGGV